MRRTASENVRAAGTLCCNGPVPVTGISSAATATNGNERRSSKRAQVTLKITPACKPTQRQRNRLSMKRRFSRACHTASRRLAATRGYSATATGTRGASAHISS